MHHAIDRLGRGDCLAVRDNFKDLGKIRFRNGVDRGIGNGGVDRSVDGVDHIERRAASGAERNVAAGISSHNGVDHIEDHICVFRYRIVTDHALRCGGAGNISGNGGVDQVDRCFGSPVTLDRRVVGAIVSGDRGIDQVQRVPLRHDRTG